MPNWCQNKVLIKGKREDIIAVKKLLKDTGEENVFSLNKILPIPDELKGTKAPPDKPSINLRKKYGFDNWYDWCIHNWGTKWDTCETQLVKETPRSLHYYFNTAWSPPQGALVALSRQFPNVRIVVDVREEGMAFGGSMGIENGEVDDNIRSL